MDLVKVTKEDSKVNFFDDIVLQNALIALEKIQNAFEGEANRLGLETEEDVVEMIKDFRIKSLFAQVAF